MIKRCQFGAHDWDTHPECANSNYLEYETIEHWGKKEIITYGYQLQESIGHGMTRFKWLPLSDVPPELRGQ